MTIKRIDQSKIRDYERSAINHFNEIEAAIQVLLNELTYLQLEHESVSGVELKMSSVEDAVTLANETYVAMQQISEVVSHASSEIASTLGGPPVNLQPPTQIAEAPHLGSELSAAKQSETDAMTRRIRAEQEMRRQYDSSGDWVVDPQEIPQVNSAERPRPHRADGNRVAGFFDEASGRVTQSFRDNFADLVSLGTDGWLGPEYDYAVGSVARLTQTAESRIQEICNGAIQNALSQI